MSATLRLHRISRARVHGLLPVALLLPVLLVGACSTNPATGRSQLTLVSEAQEQQMGLENAEQVARAMPTYDNPALGNYVDSVGQALAARSERPNLPWQFTVVDDTAVNAFALPGGYLYITRGILAWFNSEAELAAVLGHEIGHVTGRHSVEQLSRAQLAQLGLGVGSILYSPIGDMSGLISQGLGVLFLKYGRDDEREADSLGVRYMTRDGYDPNAAVRVFEMLGQQAAANGSNGIPNWLSTHPTPEDRSMRLRSLIDSQYAGIGATREGRARYLQQIDGLVFGPDPRQGFFEENRFFHPEIGFELTFPSGWQHQNRPEVVVSLDPNKRGAIQLSAVTGKLSDAVRQFRAQQGVRSSAPVNIGGELPATEFAFEVRSAQGQLAGMVRFIQFGDLVFRVMGLTNPGSFGALRPAFAQTLSSFARLTDPDRLARQPQRIRIFETTEPTTLATLAATRPAGVTPDILARLNGITPETKLEAGRLLKWVE